MLDHPFQVWQHLLKHPAAGEKGVDATHVRDDDDDDEDDGNVENGNIDASATATCILQAAAFIHC